MNVGDKINSLTMIEPPFFRNDKIRSRKYAKFKCDCGKEKIIRVDHVISGNSKTCGCVRNQEPHHTTHNLCHTRVYNIWSKMRDRCYNPNNKTFKNYGGRGIKVCDEWLCRDCFINFFNWAMENGYSDELTIDRINVDGDYEPTNCRWATWEEQENNRSNNHYITINNKTQTLKQWCKELNLRYQKTLNRIIRGWSYEEALELIPRQRRCQVIKN